MRTMHKFISCCVLFTLMPVSGFQLVIADSIEKNHYQQGAIIHADITVQDQSGAQHHLLNLIQSQEKPLSVIYIFGGGAMGAKSITRGIWCQDSYEDLHILRTLVDNYSDQVGFIAIAEPPVFHTRQMGFKDRALLDYAHDSKSYLDAYQAFVESNHAAVKKGLIPIEPYLDMGFRLLMSERQQASLNESYGSVAEWQGFFRAPNENQTYGVPAFWIVDENGEVVEPPFRGNVYHPHGDDVMNLNYSLKDIAVAINKHLGDLAKTHAD